jgi:truncated hemoglobin YjbI
MESKLIKVTRQDLNRVFCKLGGLSRPSRSERGVEGDDIGGASSQECEKQLRRILCDFYTRMSKDIMIGFFFTGKSPEEIAEHQFHFLMRAMGASASYEGRSPVQAHADLPPILSGHFDRRLQILQETLTDFNLDANSIQIWLEFENSFRDVLVK